MLILLDFLSPRYITFGTFYLVLTAYSAWALSRSAGWIVALTAVIASRNINGFGSYVEGVRGSERELAIGWNLAMRLLSSAAAIELVRGFRKNFEQARHIGEVDSLTGVMNRRAFMQSASNGLVSGGGRDNFVVLAYIDLNGFKPVNDRYGHAAGDEVLVHFADLLSKSVRSGDCVGRFGGDEFLVFLKVSDHLAGQEAISALKRRLENGLGQLHYDGLSCSIGAVIATDQDQIDDLIARADSLMYEAKRDHSVKLEVHSKATPPH